MAQAQIMTKDELLPLVKQHALQQAEKPEGQAKGWDIVVETWDDDMLRSAMGRSKKLPGAIWAVEWRLGPIASARQEHEAEAQMGAGDPGAVMKEENAASAAPAANPVPKGWDKIEAGFEQIDENVVDVSDVTASDTTANAD